VEIEVIETPGHSPDSICLCVLEAGVPVALFSGDTLFAGDVGRPDLRDQEIGSHELAAMLHHSLFDKLLKLPPAVKVYPAHGAGSLCGRQISSAPFTTIGQETATNWALQFTDRDRFVEAMVANLPDRPSYFNRSVTINLRGAPFLADHPALAHLRREIPLGCLGYCADHTVPYGTVLSGDAFPGTSCLATIMLSLRDKNHPPIGAPRIILRL
jgi:hydroxyacylglutathione hydrolase